MGGWWRDAKASWVGDGGVMRLGNTHIILHKTFESGNCNGPSDSWILFFWILHVYGLPQITSSYHLDRTTIFYTAQIPYNYNDLFWRERLWERPLFRNATVFVRWWVVGWSIRFQPATEIRLPAGTQLMIYVLRKPNNWQIVNKTEDWRLTENYCGRAFDYWL